MRLVVNNGCLIALTTCNFYMNNLTNEPGAEESKEGTTTFTSDGNEVAQTFTVPTPLSSVEVRDQALRDFMEKAVLIYTGTWQHASNINALLPIYTGAATRLDVATCLLANSIWANKIQGFQLVRGTVVFRLVLNASPFQAGRLLLHFLPCCKDFDAVDASYLAMHNATLGGKTQQPCVELDCRDSVAILKIPYCTPSTWYDIKNANYDWGTLFLSVLSPLQVGTGQVDGVDYSLYVSFEDFEMAAPLVPQSKKKFSSSNKMDSEAEAMSEGPITKGLSVVSTIASALTAVPVLAPIAGPVAWVSNIASGIASAFGWSKPTSEAHVGPMQIQPNRYSATSAGADTAYPLALIPDNKLSPIDTGSIYDGDEMSFNFLKRRWGYFNALTWVVSDTSGTRLLPAFPVIPNALADIGHDTKTTYISDFRQGPPIFYMCNFFKSYRGGIEVMFKVVKTDFHIGRLQVTFTPSRYSSETTVTLANSQLSMREIIDLRTGNEFCFKLPYLHNLNYLKVGDPLGYLDVLVLNELRAPTTVTDTIYILMYVRGADDFELEIPVSIQYPTYSPQMNQNFSSGNQELICETIGNYKDVSMTLDHAAECVGEMFTSLKQLLNRHSPTLYNSFNGQATISAQMLVWWPFHRSIVYNSSTGLKGPILSQDSLSVFGPMFAFWRGGARVQFTPRNNADPIKTAPNIQIMTDISVPGTDICVDFKSTPIEDLAYPLPLASPWITHTKANSSSHSLILVASGGVVQAQEMSGTFSYAVPYYNRLRFSLGLNQTSADVVPNDTSQPKASAIWTTHRSFNGGNLSRSFNDDFQLMYFVGCPPLVTQSVVP